MQYKVHIYSEFNALIFDNNDFKAQTNNKYGYHIEINTDNKNTFLIYSEQTFDGYKFLPYAININEILQKNNNKLVKVKNYVGLGENIIELILYPNLIADNLCDIIKSKTLKHEKSTFKVDVYSSSISINNISFAYKEPFNTTSCSIQLINNFIVVLKQNNTCCLVTIFSINDGIIIKEYQDIVLKFEIDSQASTIKILKKHNSFYQTGIVYKFLAEKEFKQTDKYFVKLGNINSKINKNLIPIAFMQCIMLKDYNYAKNYLCADLKTKLSATTLSSYFENIEEFEKCKYCEQDNILFVRYKNQDNFKPLRFIIKENKIVDMK